jgi:hypothetical protein
MPPSKRPILGLRPPPAAAAAFVARADDRHSAPSVGRPAFDDSESPAAVERLPPDVEPSTPSVGRPALTSIANDVEPSATAAQHSTSSVDGSTSAVESSAPNAQPSTPSVDHSASSVRPLASSAQPSTPSAQRSAPAAQRPASSAQRSVTAVQRPTSSVERLDMDARSSLDVGRPAVSFRRADKSMIARKKGAMRRTTVYLQAQTAADLAEYCSGGDREMSSVVDEAVRFFLAHHR